MTEEIYTLVYSGDVAVGETVCIDTNDYTVTLNSENVLDKIEGNFPKIVPNESELVYTDSNSTRSATIVISWQDKII